MEEKIFLSVPEDIHAFRSIWWRRKSLAHNHCWCKIQSRCAASNQRDSIEPMTQFAQQIHCQSGTPIIHPFTHSCSHYFFNCMSIYSILSYMQSVPHVLQHSLTASAPTPTSTAAEFHELKPSSSVPVGWCTLASWPLCVCPWTEVMQNCGCTWGNNATRSLGKWNCGIISIFSAEIWGATYAEFTWLNP